MWMKHLFRGFSIKAWKGTEFGVNKRTVYNTIVNQHFYELFFANIGKIETKKIHDEVV